jgi:hypothetical protein
VFVKDKNNATAWINKSDIEESQRANQLLSGWRFYESDKSPKAKETDASEQNSNTIK